MEAQQKSFGVGRSSSRTAFPVGPLLVAASLVLVVIGGWYTDIHRPLPNPLKPVEGLGWWFSPIERNAFMRMPVVTGDLYAVDASEDGQVIWAVGEQGLIIGTTDGGRTWRRGRIVSAASVSPVATMGAAFDIVDVLNPIARAGAGNLSPEEQKKAEAAAAYDLKAQMSKGNPPVTQRELSGSNAAAPAPRETIDSSPVNGKVPDKAPQTPIQQEAPEEAPYAQIPPVRAPQSDVDTALRSDLSGIAVIDAKRAIAVGENGTVLLTRDGGETWTPQLSEATLNFTAVDFAEANVGIAVGGDGAVFRTDDGGETWTRVELKSLATLLDVAAADAGNWVIVEEAFIHNSSDGGQTWNSQPLSPEQQLRAVTFADARNGVAVGASAVVLVTEDAGVSWTPRAVNLGNIENREELSLQSVAYRDGKIIATGQDGTGYRSEDGGYQWSMIPHLTWLHTFILRAEPYEIAAAADGRLFVIGGGGTLLASDDDGESWAPLAAHRRMFLDLEIDGARGFIVGENGTILATSDGGVTWTPRNSGVRTHLTRVQFTADSIIATSMVAGVPGETGLVRFVESRDGGATWHLNESTPPVFDDMPQSRAPFSVPAGAGARSFNGNQHALIVADGKIARTENAGNTWSSPTVDTTAPVVDVAFEATGRAIALAQGRVLISNDAGKTFESVRYRRYPSPWLWVASILLLAGSAISLRQSLRKPAVEQQPSSITDAAASDRPIEWSDPDAAGLRDIALGLSRFLRNRRTEPPLTIAVTGEWGTGKSSLMNLLRHDLVRYGYRPVWFNAWHHQSGENLLGSLLANIHAQGVPPLHTVAGMDFRLTLLAIRSKRFWWRLALTLFLLAVVFFSYETLGASAAKLWGALTDSSKDGAGITNIGAATGLLGIIAAVLTPIVGAIRAASAFGLQPAKLIAAVATTKHDESARQQAGARYRFAREFADFTRALDPRPLVIFIDDLDRCRAENVIEVLEAVNFLISSGRCIVVIGMARRWVETCVGLEFKELAEAHIEGRDEGEQEESADAPSEQQMFARHYLEKLINVEIRVPRLSDSAAGAILQGSEPAARSSNFRYGLGTALLRTGAVVVLVAMIAGLIGLGKTAAEWLARLDSTTTLTQSQAATQAASSAQRQQSPTTASERTQQQETEDREIVFDAPRAQTSMGWYFGTGTSLALALAAFVAVAMFARKESRTDDSPAFRDALAILQPWIVVGGSSPRSLKRFVNHMRYIAMRFRPGADIPTAYEKLTNRIRAWFGRAVVDTSKSSLPARLQLNEELLVALAALHRCGDSWLDELFISRERDLDTLIFRDVGSKIDDLDQRRQVMNRLKEAIAVFNQRFGDSRLFVNEMLDRGHAIAFYEVMAFETGAREQTDLGWKAEPAPLKSA